MLNIDEPAQKQPKVPLFRLGFRPFFLFGSVFSIIALTLWILFLTGNFQFSPHGNTVWWHAHEMLFGFVTAIIAGFLLTAVQNWTGRPSIKGIPLALLFALWTAPRILLLNQDWVIFPIVAALDLLFLPITAFLMAKAVLPVKQWQNFTFVPILFLLTLTNAISYYGLVTNNPELIQSAHYGGVFTITIVVTMIGGRVIPFFTDRASDWKRQPSINWIEKLTFTSLVLLIGSILIQQQTAITIFAALSGSILLIRWSRWGWTHTFKVPLLWSLHLSYVFIPIGLLMIAAGLPLSAGIHAITVGGMAGMILGMMARVSLGHTGRQLVPPKPVVLGFGCILLATLSRIVATLIPTYYQPLLILTAVLWIIAFGLFVIFYSSMLCKARIDGRPG
ncbi:NnrS family protein [Parashewanella spongiae]|uniref:NnrS family protein n=1 Tax=Parashewanella spongiae TaxID=342950 RepID=A0A3A6TKJ7_9GAMM|nr:NnrS family protein [Parashewanella spongiae]MCL1078682.1 NnrS family protein [Parashewanella spongiae]RJY12945.1 NnrS family protein [Parashewanella spongiae]